MPTPEAVPSRPIELAHPEPGAAVVERDAPAPEPEPAKRRPPSVCYMGFRTTEDGREYSMRVTSDVEPRHFVLLVTHQAFAAHEARFQDAPGLCFGKLQRELAAHPDLLPGSRLVVTAEELLDYRATRDARAPERKRRAPAR